MNLDHQTLPEGHKTARRRGWRITLLRRLAKSSRSFTARDLLKLVPRGTMSLHQARALCQSYLRKGELRRLRKGIGGCDSVEAVYTAHHPLDKSPRL